MLRKSLIFLVLGLGVLGCSNFLNSLGLFNPSNGQVVGYKIIGDESFVIDVAGQSYEFNRPTSGGTGFSSACQTISIDTSVAVNPGNGVWDSGFPHISIQLCFHGYDATVGIQTPMVLDLSDAQSSDLVSIAVNVSTPLSNIVGQLPVYARYGGYDFLPGWLPGTTGTIEIIEFSGDSDSIFGPDSYEVRLTNVVLKKSSNTNEDPASPIWPDEVRIIEAHASYSREPL